MSKFLKVGLAVVPIFVRLVAAALLTVSAILGKQQYAVVWVGLMAVFVLSMVSYWWEGYPKKSDAPLVADLLFAMVGAVAFAIDGGRWWWVPGAVYIVCLVAIAFLSQQQRLLGRLEDVLAFIIVALGMVAGTSAAVAAVVLRGYHSLPVALTVVLGALGLGYVVVTLKRSFS